MGHKSPVFLEHEYLDHICMEHRGKVMNSVVLYKTFCISDRIVSDREEFDINLFPLTAKEQNDRRLVDFRHSTAPPENLLDVEAYLKSFDDLKVET